MVQQYEADGLKRRILNSEHKTLHQVVSVKDQLTTTSNIEVYPNPVQDRLKITVNNGRTHKLKLADMNGKVFEVLQFSHTAEVDMSSLSPGNYLLYLDDGSVVHTRKIVKE